MQNREFLGVWIPASIWTDERLNMNEKCLLAEIESLGGSKNGCYASNYFLTKFLGCKERYLQYALENLKKMGLIEIKFTDNKRMLFVNPPQYIAPPPAIYCTPPRNILHPPIYKDREISLDNSFFNEKSHEQQEEEKKDSEKNVISSFEELKRFVKLGEALEQVPWRDVENCLSDWWLLCESKNYSIRKRSAHLGFMRYLRGGDKKKMEEEKRAWEESQRKKALKSSADSVDFEERRKDEEKRRISEKYIQEHPDLMSQMEVTAFERAMRFARGNEKNAKLIQRGVLYSLAYEMATGSKK